MLETPTVFTVAERPLEWDELSEETFDPRWMLPAAPPEGQPNLLAEMEQLADLRFGLDAPDGTRLETLGDFLAASRGMDFEQRSAWWNQLQAQRPELFAEWGSRLFLLTFDDFLVGLDWKPSKEHARDGIIEGQQWTLGEEAGAPWSELSGDVRLNQAALWIDADLAAIKQVENDYASYPDHVGADFEAIYPLENTAWRGRDAERGEFSGLRLYFRCDLPFPFSDYECDLHMLNRRDARGRLVTDIYSTSADFHWLAGRDVFLPLFTSGGEPAGHLLVRVYGFDLAGVPDRDHHRMDALRASVGNLKRLAQAVPTATDTAPDAIPRYAIRGVR
ncbi:MAG: hypothetical protein KDC14_03835 [Planctomycetes bacterium]|nr:hypothetical protein [Planctomycetota bacterium]